MSTSHSKFNDEVCSIGTVKDVTAIPNCLKARDQWAIWCGDIDPHKPEKINKVARVANNFQQKASSTNFSNWCPFKAAIRSLQRLQSKLDREFSGTILEGQYGLAFALFESDPFVGIDLDSVFDQETGELLSWAFEAVHLLDTYTEWSPSGTGLRLFAEGELSIAGKKKGNHASGAIEVYTQNRYLTVTGDRFDG